MSDPGNNPFEDCHDNGLAGQTVSIAGPSGYADSMQTVILDDIPAGVAAFENLVAGSYHVAEDVPGDTVSYYVFCLNAENDEPVEFRYDDSRDEGIDIRLAEGLNVVCDWYIVPDQGDDEEPVEEEPAEEEPADEGDDEVSESAATARVEVHLAECEPGYDMSAANSDPFKDCHEKGIADQIVSISGPDDYADSMETVVLESPGPGVAAFENLAAGSYHIAEDIPGDTVTYYVFCINAENDEPVEFRYDDSRDEGIDIRLAEGLNIVCDWYIVPEQQTDPAEEEPVSSIQVTKYTCTPGYGGSSYADFRDDCTEPTNGVTFLLGVEGGADPTVAVTGEESVGVVFYGDLAPGNYSLSEDVPGDVSTPRAYCRIDGGKLFRLELGDDGVGFFDNVEGQEITCDWYNVPDQQFETASFTVTNTPANRGTKRAGTTPTSPGTARRRRTASTTRWPRAAASPCRHHRRQRFRRTGFLRCRARYLRPLRNCAGWHRDAGRLLRRQRWRSHAGGPGRRVGDLRCRRQRAGVRLRLVQHPRGSRPRRNPVACASTSRFVRAGRPATSSQPATTTRWRTSPSTWPGRTGTTTPRPPAATARCNSTV